MALAGAVVAGLVLAGCAGPDLSPVPVPGEEPFVCHGVSGRAVELMFGAPVGDVTDSGSWGFPRDRLGGADAFGCNVDPEGRDDAALIIHFQPLAWGYWADTEENLLAYVQDRSGPRSIEASAPGWGYRWGEEDDVGAVWTCDDYALIVRAWGSLPEGRDRGEDVERLLVSMLPWACEGVEAPRRTGG